MAENRMIDLSGLSVAAVAVRSPIAVPVRTSFGTMRDRPAVFLEVADGRGGFGLGEVWCNFPSVGAEHRARLVNEVVGPALGQLGEVPLGAVFDRLMEALHILAIQSGEWGPLRQVAAGIDMACHDLCARRAGEPLWRFLGGAGDEIAAYASGIGPERPAEVAAAKRAEGYRAFKLKVGFGEAADRRALDAIRGALGPGDRLMVDANQAWSVEQALDLVPRLAGDGLLWLEEPLPADRPAAEWQGLAAVSTVPLAAGENMNALGEFEAAIATGWARYLQPDAAKWGGVSGCLAVGRMARAAGLTYCPHYLGGGIGLLASAHLLAAVGGDGLLEIDSNPNPLRERIAGDRLVLRDGRLRLGADPGLGIDVRLPDLAACAA